MAILRTIRNGNDPLWLEMTDLNAASTGAEPPTRVEAEVLHVDLDGYEGPLDLLLDLARRQKVDLSDISVLELSEQYLAFIETTRSRRIELAADYLVMAAWLAYLKSRLMVPQSAGDDEPTGEMLAAILQLQLKRLEAMRTAATQLMGRPTLGREVFGRGAPEPTHLRRHHLWEASYYDLLKAYASQLEKGAASEYSLFVRSVWSLQDAREVLQGLIGANSDWVALDTYLSAYAVPAADRVTAKASTFASSLELVRLGEIDIRQTATFGPLLMRRKGRTMAGKDQISGTS